MFEGFLPSRTDLDCGEMTLISEIIKGDSVKEAYTFGIIVIKESLKIDNFTPNSGICINIHISNPEKHI